jgi:hypothetical protein
MVDGVQRMSDVCQITADGGPTRETAHCRAATHKPGFPTVQASSSAQHPSNALKPIGTTVCLPSDHLEQIYDRQCLSNLKKPNQHYLDI